MHKVSFSQSHSAVQKKRIVFYSGIFRHRLACSSRELVAFSHYKAVEGIFGYKIGVILLGYYAVLVKLLQRNIPASLVSAFFRRRNKFDISYFGSNLFRARSEQLRVSRLHYIYGYVAVRAYQQLVVGYAHRFRLRQPIVVRHRGNRPLSFQQHVFPYLF